ncbi:MED6-domain-containing protein [Coprinopsis marcescibilis]|uniref:Mediator of RNA polymerase II transcription subunit 6 n=1 Tax=Coprinopsis marcescibilis TaxID=230819 RepID=A0A5C3KRI6_COPMA|nr:MED6-domain-containing protein [Coprinopsis marcescibilis]
MDIDDLHPTNPFGSYFIWHEWIQVNGPLTAENVFEYFSHSDYYDKQSNNQVLRMQTTFTGAGPLTNEAEELRRFTGIEFAVVHAEPPSFFIIHKRERLSPDEVKPVAVYFIIDNQIFQAPDLYSLLSNHLLTTVSTLQSSLDILRKNRPDYTPRTGFVWPIVGDPANDPKKKGPEVSADAAALADDDATEPSSSQANKRAQETAKRENTILLFNALTTTARHSKVVEPTAAVLPSDASTADSPATTSQLHSSATPAPGSQEVAIKGVNPATAGQDPLKKKRKKRSSVAAPPHSAGA